MKRGQFEAMGLAVVVVLVSIGMFMFIFLNLGSRPDFAERYNREQLSQNTIDAMLKTTVQGCQGVTVQNLIEDASILHRNPCKDPEGRDSKALLQNISITIIEQVLETRGMHSKFSINVTDGEQLVLYDTCDGTETENDRTGYQPLPLYPTDKQADIELTICFAGNV